MNRPFFTLGLCSLALGTLVAGCSLTADGEYDGNYPGDPVEVPAPLNAPVEEPAPQSCGGLDSSKPLTLYLSSDDSNSMATAARIREAVNNGFAVGHVRGYELFNYYPMSYPAPELGQLAIFAEAAPSEDVEGEYSLQLGVRSWDAPAERRPMTVTFVLDTSGSMGGVGMEREVAAILAIAGRLQSGDVVNMVTWSTEQNIVLDGHVAVGPNDAVVVQAAASLAADGGTDLHSGLVTGYELALKNYDASRLNRLVLISDGGANVGVTDAELIGAHANANDDDGVYLVGIGTGPVDWYSDELMDVVTDAGRGAYVYLDSEAEAEKILGERFHEVMEVAARGVQVELTLPWYMQMQTFYGEEYSEDPKEVKPQHLAPNDAMVFLQTLKACDPTVVSSADPVTIKVTWQTPITKEPREAILETSLGELLAAPKPNLSKGLALAAYADFMRDGDSDSLTRAMDRVHAADPEGTDADLLEISHVITQYATRSP